MHDVSLNLDSVSTVPRNSYSTIRLLGLSLLLSALVWTLFSWPLARHMDSGIPMAHSGGAADPLRYMEPGDHLQLLYYFWLFSDMVLGETPWMYNPYEFHTGDEEARYEPHSYYAPYSWSFTVVTALGGSRALAYNLSAFLSIWLTLLFTWQLVRRYVRSDTLGALAGMLSITLPYRWFALLGGSPTGFAMTWVPLAFWGLDMAIRDERLRGGFITALAVLFAYTSDVHVFFFVVLALPAWSLFTLWARPVFKWKNWRAYLPMARSLWPVALVTLAAAIHGSTGSLDLSETNMAAGRAWEEVIGASPSMRGFLGWREHHLHSQIYLGYTVLLLFAAGFLLAVQQWRNSRDDASRRTLWLMLLLAIAMGTVGLLAVGPHGPLGGLALRVVRRLIPPYAMIRQSGKVFALMPTLLALWTALSMNCLPQNWKRRWRTFTISLLALLIFAEYQRRMDPPISLLTTEQSAYAAVATDAQSRAVIPHAFIVTLWPGDSHLASLYQYYCSLYRIRMINGYTPAVDSTYFEKIFLPFQTINQGWLTDTQADELMGRGIQYLIVHADLFPEKVSPFPIIFTLRHFAAHPRLTALKQDGPIWAFRIEPGSQATDPAPLEWTHPLMAARHWLLDLESATGGLIQPDGSASRGEYLQLNVPNTTIRVAATSGPPATNLRWLFRARGQGTLQVRSLSNAQQVFETNLAIDTPDWDWFVVPLPIDTYADLALDLELGGGTIDLCSTLLIAGAEWSSGDTIPAAAHFHAGYLDLASGFVHLRAGQDRRGPVFYGPKLPVGRGRVTVRLDFSSPADTGTPLGEIELEQLFSPMARVTEPVIAGQPAIITVNLEENLPVNLIFHFAGEADITLQSVTWDW